MRPHRREPGRAAALAAAALLAALGCSDTRRPAASPSPSPPTVAVTSGSPIPSPSPERRWIVGVIGDWGVDAPPVRQVVRAMGRFNGGRPLDAVVTTGDNAYCCGTADESAFARRVIAPLTRRGTPVYPALGNHDIVTSGGAAFMRTFGMRERWYTRTVGPVEYVILDANRTSDRDQLAFVRRTLAAPRRAAFRVVAFHQPGWSCSAHAPDDGVIRRWLPLFAGSVDLVLAGHNHTYERFAAADGTPYVTTGGGGASLYPSARVACRGAGTVRYLRTVHHAVRLTGTATSLRLDAIGLDGKAFDTLTLRPRG